MTLTQLLQFYAPLAGLLAVVFWLGVLSERVKTLQRRVDDLETQDGAGKSGERLTRLEVHSENIRDSLAAMERSMAGVQRQLGNLATHPPPREYNPGAAE